MLCEIVRQRYGEHVESRFGHVGVRVAAALLAHRELALERAHVDDVAPVGVALRGRERGIQNYGARGLGPSAAGKAGVASKVR